MRSIPAHRPSPATVISMIALFVALAGTAWASVGANSVNSNKVKNNTLKSVDIKDNNLTGTDVKGNSLKGGDIDEGTLSGVSPSGSAGGDLTGTYPNPLVGTNAIGSDEIAPDSLLAGDLAPDSVGTSEVAANSLGTADLADSSVNTGEIVNGGVNAADVGENFHEHFTAVSVTDATALDGNWSQTALTTASCAAGEELVGVANEWTTAGDELAVNELNPNFTTEQVTGQGISDDGGTDTVRIIAICFS